MAWPTLAVRIATGAQADALTLDDATLGKLNTGGVLGDGYTLDWTDITADVRESTGVNINRGATNQQGPYFRAEAGRCTFTLDNRNGTYDPFNLLVGGVAYGDGSYGTSTYGGSSPWVQDNRSLLHPGLPISVQATYDGVTYDLFRGFVTSWMVDFPEYAVDSVAVVTAHDVVGRLSNASRPESFVELGDGENAGARITRILDNVGWYAGARVIDTTSTDSFQPTTLSDRAWAEMQNVADDVNGYLWADPAGVVRFQNKSQFPRTADFQVGTATGSVPTAKIQVSNDPNQLYNVVKLGRDDGVTGTVTDQTSIDDYGSYSFERSGMRVDSDEQVQDSLTYVLSQYKDHRLRVEGFEVPLTDTSTDLAWQRMLELDLTRRVEASFQTPDGRTIEREGLVRGISLSVRYRNWRWSVSTTAAPEALGTFTLDSSSLGLLDTGTLAAF